MMIERSNGVRVPSSKMNKRTYLVIAGLVTIVLVLVQAMAITGLAVLNPFLPGNAFFPLQTWCEEAAAWVFTPGADRAEYYLELAEQRTDDLEARIGTAHELAALTTLETALDRASAEIERSTGNQVPVLWARLLTMVQRSEEILPRLTQIPKVYEVIVMAFQARLHTLQNMAASRRRLDWHEELTIATGSLVRAEASAATAATGGTALPGGLIPFPPGSPGSTHIFYAMTGRHTALECRSCHTTGIYRGTSSSCEGCHREARPNVHYSGGCVACHNPNGWQEVVFDHIAAGAVDCLGCHASDTPANHYSGQCSQCHSPAGWPGAAFNHAGYSDCQRCHAGDAPANHFSGQCSQCHSTNGWPGAAFNHAGYTDCFGCHAGDAPANHFNGQCSQCHSTTGWRGASFNHAGYTDCLGCHAGDAPRDHFNGQCSQCHNQSSWGDASFNHGSQTDCQACHLDDRPREHDAGQCSECHNTNKWDD